LLPAAAHHHNASLPGGFHCLVHRIERVALEYIGRPSDMLMTRMLYLLLQRDRFLNGGDHLAVGA
jgi:hypothetical protein